MDHFTRFTYFIIFPRAPTGRVSKPNWPEAVSETCPWVPSALSIHPKEMIFNSMTYW